VWRSGGTMRGQKHLERVEVLEAAFLEEAGEGGEREGGGRHRGGGK